LLQASTKERHPRAAPPKRCARSDPSCAATKYVMLPRLRNPGIPRHGREMGEMGELPVTWPGTKQSPGRTAAAPSSPVRHRPDRESYRAPPTVLPAARTMRRFSKICRNRGRLLCYSGIGSRTTESSG
jgi:hypothetical protein